jgi:hypothetical protein
MATCKYCGKSGWFLSLTDVGLCDDCAQVLQPQINRAVQIITESVEIVNKSKNPETKLSRLDIIEEITNKHLRPFEEKGIEVTEGQSPFQILAYVRDFRDKIILESLKSVLDEAKIKAEKAKTPKAKMNAYSKVLQRIVKWKEKVSNPHIIVDVESEVKELINKHSKNEQVG